MLPWKGRCVHRADPPCPLSRRGLGARLQRRKQGQGFTLVEMLVTLVIVAAVTALLWEALGLAARLERSLAQAGSEDQARQLRAAWLQMAVDSLAIPPGHVDALRGSPQRLEGLTTAPPWPGSPGPEAFALELRPDTEPGGDMEGALTRVRGLRLWALRPATGETFDLGRWDRTSRFSYLDEQARWHDVWPPEGVIASPAGVQRPLPRAVRLAPDAQDGGDLAAVHRTMLVAPQATRNPMLTRRQAAPPDDRP